MRRFDSGTVRESADFLQRARQPSRIACELHGRSIGQDFALAANCRLNQSSEECACPPNDNERQTNQRQRILASTRPDEYPTDNGEAKNSKDQTHEAQIQSHVAVENVAELVSDYSLKFVTRK